MSSSRRFGGLALAVLAVVLSGVLAWGTPSWSALAVGEPPPASVINAITYTFYPPTARTGSGTVYSASPRRIAGQDVSHTRLYASADVFATADFATTGAMTVTAQWSPDAAVWADASYWIDAGTTVSEIPYRVVLSADGTKAMRIPLAGEYTRFKIEYTASVTPTVLITLRNLGGGTR